MAPPQDVECPPDSAPPIIRRRRMWPEDVPAEDNSQSQLRIRGVPCADRRRKSMRFEDGRGCRDTECQSGKDKVETLRRRWMERTWWFRELIVRHLTVRGAIGLILARHRVNLHLST